MKPLLSLVSFILLCGSLGAQTPQTKIGLWWGSWNGTYLHGVNEITLEVALPPQDSPWSILGKIRSYGTWFFIAKESYDFELGGSYQWNLAPQLSLKTQAGLSLQLRTTPDIRSQAQTTWAPWIQAVPEFRWEGLQVRTPLKYYFFGGGYFFRSGLELGWDFPWLGLQLRGELDSLALADLSLWEHRLKTFIGLTWPGSQP